VAREDVRGETTWRARTVPFAVVNATRSEEFPRRTDRALLLLPSPAQNFLQHGNVEISTSLVKDHRRFHLQHVASLPGGLNDDSEFSKSLADGLRLGCGRLECLSVTHEFHSDVQAHPVDRADERVAILQLGAPSDKSVTDCGGVRLELFILDDVEDSDARDARDGTASR